MVSCSHDFDCESETPVDNLITQCVGYEHDANYPIPTSSRVSFAHDL
jgi:hypothetical protein